MKVAIVHDWLETYAGAERVLEQMLLCYPDADLFSVVDFVRPVDRDFLMEKSPVTTFIQRLPFARKHFRKYLALMPLAIEQLDLSSYDLVISSSHAVAKGVLTGADQVHVSYVYSPLRYAWDLQQQYLDVSGLTRGPKSWLARRMLHKLRIWDQRTANGVDQFLTLSNFVSRRIWKTYRREAKVIYPAVDTEFFALREAKEDFYVTASRMVPYKRIDVIVATFAGMPDRKLVVIGDGPERRRIESLGGPNIEFLGYQSNEVIRDHLQSAKAFLFAAEEDFGIVPIEAQACGTPVIAYGKGGVLETVRGADSPQPTGAFFEHQTAESLGAAVETFETALSASISPTVCRENALRFAPERFRESLVSEVGRAMEHHHAPRP